MRRRTEMNFKRIFAVVIMLLFSLSAYAGQDSAVKGVYEKLSDQKHTFDGKQIEIIEFLSFYCGHCYHFEKAIPVIKGNFPKKIRWKTIPIYWGDGSPKPGEAYFLAEEAGKGEEMKKALFHALFVEKRDIGKIEVLEDIGMKAGLGFDFSRRLRTGEKAKQVGEAILMSNTYGIDETPTLIIAGNLKTKPGMFQGNLEIMKDNTITVLKSIFKK
jgi:thiol:disulfide interchange protein DsbA